MKFIWIALLSIRFGGRLLQSNQLKHIPDYQSKMFTYKVFFHEPRAVWGQGCALIQEATQEAALLFFHREFPGCSVTAIVLTLNLPI